MSLFGGSSTNNLANKSNPFGGLSVGTNPAPSNNLFGQSQQNASQGLFGNTSTNQQTNSMFGGPASQANKPPSLSLFGSSTAQPQQQNQASTNPFGSSIQQNASNPFGQSAQAPASKSLFGTPMQPSQQTGLFNSTNQQPNSFANSAQAAPSLRRSVNPVWQPGSVLGIRERSVPEQMQVLLEKWSPRSAQCSFTTYFYDQAPEQYMAFFGPDENEDAEKWEEAYKKRPFARAVPHLSRGFEELGQRLRTQTEAVSKLQQRIHEINASLDAILSKHDLEISVKVLDAKRRHIALSQRTLKLASKVQVLRNRGYNLDSAEEQLKAGLRELERKAFDPVLVGRSEEIWARLVGLKTRMQYLQAELDKRGDGKHQGSGLDEEVVRKTKKILSEYDSQISRLKEELDATTKDFAEQTESVAEKPRR